MSVAYGKGEKKKATELHSLLIRSLGYCENCGYSCTCPNFPDSHTRDCRLQAAHIISRRYSVTRTMLSNSFSLCASCHRRFTDWPREFSHFITDTWAADYYDQLKELARPTGKVDWSARLIYLKDIKQRMANGLTLKEARELEE